ncbi:MAG: hypothetical protein COB67_06210 [SAR324 cluster bacterium]|uniref:Uncharacterized protein n=1 Tax=SAR324 cluster bacterium TaxID=2024889 RepID=A0A2A4T539_9DELT|nr:MAG: hypothetical protein COB67_06210 [SAR324 cluster bacterium]
MADESFGGTTLINQKAAEKTVHRGLGISQKGTKKRSKNSKKPSNEGKQLQSLLPFSPQFLGKSILYKKLKKRQQKAMSKLELSPLRLDVVKFAARQGICRSRDKLQKLLQEFPSHAELHALNAILTYTDCQESGQDEEKLFTLKDVVIEMATALHNGGDSVFNITWFLKIYITYLVSLQERFKRLLSVRPDPELKRYQQQLRRLSIIREQMDLQLKLQRMLKGTFYFLSITTEQELKASCKAFLENDENRKIGQRKKANYILYINQMTLFVLSHVPIMENYVENTLNMIPDIHRDLILKKRMILASMTKMKYSMALGKNDIRSAREYSSELYNFSLAGIKEYLEHAKLQRDFEVGPFLTLAWIVIDSKLVAHERSRYRTMLLTAKEYMQAITGKRCDDEHTIYQASQFLFSLKGLIEQYE